jgi:hypothetical protein
MSIKVLHIYPSTDSMIAQYVSLLKEDKSVEMMVCDEPKQIQQHCKDFGPHILHLHGCNAPSFTKAALWARSQGIRIVVTPHGQLEPWDSSSQNMVNTNLPTLISHAYAMIARSPIEAEELRKQGWNSRLETVYNPIVTRSTTITKMQEAHRRIYEQVMSSNVLELIDEKTKSATRTLIKVGITDDNRWGNTFDPNPINWNIILIYAKLEGITSYIERGMTNMGISIQESNLKSQYLPDGYTKPESIAGKPIIEMVREIRDNYEANELALLPLIELDRALRYDDVEDDVLMQQLKSEKLDSFFSALMQILKEQSDFDEGFMPCPPTNGAETERIRDRIKKHLEI